MTILNKKFISTLLIPIILLFPNFAYLQELPELTTNVSTQDNEVKPDTNDSVDSAKESTSKVDPQQNVNSATKNQKNLATTSKVTSNKSEYPTLTDDQVAMSADELLNDPDLLNPIVKRSLNGEDSDLDVEDDGDYEGFASLEEINFDDDFDIPEFAQKLLDESYPDYYPPTGKLFGFMRRHLLKRGDSPKPWTITDDFNGDKKPDWAALMVNKEKQLDVIVIYSEDDKYRLEVLYEGAGIDNNSIKIELSQEKPGDKVGASYKNKPGKFRTATLEFPGINIMYYTKSSTLFYWHSYYFDELLTSN
ncbi:MAG: hypothetical protein ACC657_02540 [Thiohalomonadales bacterium]